MLKIRLILTVTILWIIVKNSFVSTIRMISSVCKVTSIVSGMIMLSIITTFALADDASIERLRSLPFESLRPIAQSYMIFYLIGIAIFIIHSIMTKSENLINAECKDAWNKYKSNKEQLLAKATMLA